MAGARLFIVPRLVSARWQRMASARESNNQTAIGGSRRPTEKIAAQKLTGHMGQKKKIAAQQSMDRAPAKEKSWRSNWGIALAKRKMQRGN